MKKKIYSPGEVIINNFINEPKLYIISEGNANEYYK